MNRAPARILIVGAGLSGATVARILAEAGHQVELREQRGHVAGNCHTERDPQTGIMLHRYGPHIFHTDNPRIWRFVQRFSEMMPYRHQVKTTVGGQVFGLPINLHTINQFFGTAMGPEEARAFIAARQMGGPGQDISFEARARSQIGPELYQAFFEGYTTKQWGCAPHRLPAAIFARLPVRYNYEDSYFAHPFQGMPRHGYTAMVQNMLQHEAITLRLGTVFQPSCATGFDHVFFTGALDAFFDQCEGPLPYRTLRFEHEHLKGDYQGCAVMNYADAQVAHTRITEHKHFAPWETHQDTVISAEFPSATTAADVPFYPLRALTGTKGLARYVARAQTLENITFLGRLGTFRYIDMDVAIAEAMDVAQAYLDATATRSKPPVFSVPPL